MSEHEHVNYSDEQWNALTKRLCEAVEIPYYGSYDDESDLNLPFEIAERLIQPVAPTASYGVRYNAMSQDYVATITTKDADYMGCSNDAGSAMLLALELWLDKRVQA